MAGAHAVKRVVPDLNQEPEKSPQKQKMEEKSAQQPKKKLKNVTLSHVQVCKFERKTINADNIKKFLYFIFQLLIFIIQSMVNGPNGQNLPPVAKHVLEGSKNEQEPALHLRTAVSHVQEKIWR